MFVLFISETALSRIPGLSAAGSNLEALPYTAPADSDMLFYDRPKVVDQVPLDPFGHPTPAIVTRAAVIEGGFPVMSVRAGTSVAPCSPFIDFNILPGRDIRAESAVANPHEIEQKAKDMASSMVFDSDPIVIAESIPGGTTTALTLLRSLGYEGMVSSAGPVNPLSTKESIWNNVCTRLNIGIGGLKGEGIKAAAEVGDPMQIAAASFVAAMPKDKEVVLAGGTQMMAVAALIRDMGDTRPLLVATTKYIIDDKSGCFEQYAKMLDVKTYAAPLDFSRSRYKGLADYENGFVKEGVGMGGAVWYAIQKGSSIEKITKRTEELYEKMTE